MLNLEGLSPMQVGRINKWCDTKVHYQGAIMTNFEVLISRLSSSAKVTKKCTNNEYKWNRRMFNKMGSCKEQNEYEAKLKAGRSYFVYFGEYSAEIPKIIFDVLNVPEEVAQ